MSDLLPFPLLWWLAVGISLPSLLPQPESTMAVWCVIAAVCLRETILLWWRTKLAFTAAAYVIITGWCALMAALYAVLMWSACRNPGRSSCGARCSWCWPSIASRTGSTPQHSKPCGPRGGRPRSANGYAAGDIPRLK